MNLESLFNQAWYGKSKWTHLFLPLLPLVSALVQKKRARFLAQQDKLTHFQVPVLVVGNITVGGTGKSPMVIALIKALKQAGYRPGIVSRGYGVNAVEPISVTQSSVASECGDEPVMLVRRTLCPMVICQDRTAAIKLLLHDENVDLVISDDGMQHYAMSRDIEILMLDENRGLGNGALLPVGPLREPTTRLNHVDFIASLTPFNERYDEQDKTQQLERLLSQYPNVEMDSIKKKIHPLPLDASELINLITGESAPLNLLQQYDNWQLVAGIGNPDRFLNTLLDKGLPSGYRCNWLADHHKFSSSDIHPDFPVVMTEKDAVKCKDLTLKNDNVWYLPIDVCLPQSFVDTLLKQIKQYT